LKPKKAFRRKRLVEINTNMTEIKVPSVGESISEVEIGEWLKKEGETVSQDETLVLLDSAKTTVELPSPASGVIKTISKHTGEAATVGDVIGVIEEIAGGSGEAGSTPKAAEPQPEWEKPVTQGEATRAGHEQAEVGSENAPQKNTASKTESANGFVMPSAARVLHEKGVDAKTVSGTGPGGRVLKEDAQNAAAQNAAAQAAEDASIEHPAPTAAPTPQARSTPDTTDALKTPVAASQPPAADEEVVPLSMLRRHIAQRLVEAQQNAALLTTFNEIDMSAVMQLRKENQEHFQKKYGIKLGFMSFFVKAVVDALKQTPQINAEIRDKNIVFKNHYDIGVAIGSGKGLVVPVLRNAERLSFAEVEKGIADFAARIKDNKLMPDELAGGTFTITNGGIFGSLLSTPIVNPPQSGILGMHSIQERPIALNGEVVIRPMMYVALTYDHRIVDGREAVTFLVRIKECIENPARMLIEV
jgi:2-oxoglutarate dehydrogenase E2 component (dihydrolipoamide succinyltransferase)